MSGLAPGQMNLILISSFKITTTLTSISRSFCVVLFYDAFDDAYDAFAFDKNVEYLTSNRQQSHNMRGFASLRGLTTTFSTFIY